MRRPWIVALLTTSAALALSFFLAVTTGTAQERGGGQRGGAPAAKPMPAIPRMPDGTPNLAWVDSNFKGMWRSGQHWEYGKDQIDPAAKAAGLPYQPWARALKTFREQTNSKDDPEVFCVPAGGPRATSTMGMWEFIQIPQQKKIVRIFHEIGHMHQTIYMDGRSHPQEAYELPTWLGHSIGHWEGDSLVVDTVGFNEGHWMDRSGDIRTSQQKLIEKFTRTDYNTIHYEATVDDPGAYTKPWTIGWDVKWVPGAEMEEYVCQENNRYLEHYENYGGFEGVDPALYGGKPQPKK